MDNAAGDKNIQDAPLPTVCVTGASGFLGISLVNALLILGYTKSSEYLSSLILQYPHKLALFHIEDIANSQEIMDGALRNCRFVVHIPIGFATQETKNNMLSECLDPIVQTSLMLYQCTLRESRRQFQQKPKDQLCTPMRIIFAGSCHSVDNKNPSKTDVHDETNWNRHSDLDDTFTMARTLAERALWELYKSDEAHQVNLEVSSLLFPSIIGPIPHQCEFLLSQEFLLLSDNSLIFDLLSGYYSATLPYHLSILDVRDAVSAILSLMQTKSYENSRILLTNESEWILQLSRLLHDNFPSLPLPTKSMTTFRAQISLLLSKSAIRKRYKSEKMNQITCYSKEQMSNKLRFAPGYSLQDTILDCANSLIESGVIRRQQQVLQQRRKKRFLVSGSSVLVTFLVFVFSRYLLKKLGLTWRRIGKQMLASLLGPFKI